MTKTSAADIVVTALAIVLISTICVAFTVNTKASRPLLIAHRGASGYAPEHTTAAYELAMKQGADFVEQDLQVTKDGVLICIHDPDLARTTDVSTIFPDRSMLRDPQHTGTPQRGWYTIDFTLAEIKKLDAGSWFNRANPFAANQSYAGLKVPTLEETISLVAGRAGLYIELKEYTFYKALGIDTAAKLSEVLKKHGFDRPAMRDRIFIQSFYKEALLRMREVAPGFRRVQLLPMETAGREKDTAVVTASLATELAEYANGAGPSKSMLKTAEDVVLLHKAGLVIHPYTFRGTTSANSRRPLGETINGSTVREGIISDIRKYLGLGIDGGFTDFPDLWREMMSSISR